MAFNWWCASWSRCVGVFDRPARGIVAAKGVCRAGEARAWGAWVVSTRSRSIPSKASLVRRRLRFTTEGATYFWAFLMIFFLSLSAALGFSTAKPDFSPPAYRSGLSSSAGSKSSSSFSSSSSSSPWPWPAWLGPRPPLRSPNVANFFFGAWVAGGGGGMLEDVCAGSGAEGVADGASEA